MSDELKNQTQEAAATEENPTPEEEKMEEAVEEVEADQKDAEDAIHDEIAEAAKQQQAIKDQMLRLQADFDNFRKRAAREKTEIANYTMENFMEKLLPVLDNLERAEKNAGGTLESYQQGVQMVFNQLLDVLKAEGLSEVETEGKKFDPNFHHGVAIDNSPDHEDQDITDVYQKGYQYKDKVIRPAMVKVCQK